MVAIEHQAGPKGRFLTGHFAEFQGDTLGFLARCARTYGDVVPLRFGPLRALLVSDPELIEQVLVTKQRSFVKSPAYRVVLRRVIGDGLVTSDGELWRRQRRLAQPAFHRERLAAYGAVMAAYAERTVAQWRDGEVRDLHRDLMRLTLEIATKTLFDADVGRDVAEVDAALAIVREELNVRLTSLQFFLPAWVPTPGNLRLRRAVGRLDAIIQRLIAERRARAGDRGDLLSTLLRATDEDGGGLSDAQLRDHLMTLFIAGHETTAITLAWTAYLLAQHPDAEERLRGEVREVLDGRAPTPDDLPRLRYTEAVLWEALRLYPPAIALGRQAIEDCELGTQRVPKGTIVLMSQWVTHRDPRSFEAPESFRPERWLDGLAKRLPRFAYFPFGGGPRVCLGASFAMTEAAIVLATLVRRARLVLIPGETIAADAALTLRPRHGLRMTVKLLA